MMDRIDDIEATLNHLSGKIDEIADSVDTLETYECSDELKNEIEDLNEKVEKLTRLHRELHGYVNSLAGRITDLEVKLENQS